VRIEAFHNFLEAVENSPVDIHEMKSLLDRHPYSHVVRLAYLKSLHAIGDDRLGRALDEAAIHLPDRKVLYAFMEHLEEARSIEQPSLDEATVEKADETEIVDTPKDEEVSRTLQRQYLTEAVQSSILLEVGEEAESALQEDVESSKSLDSSHSAPPASFLDFIAGESSVSDVMEVQFGSGEVIARFLSNSKREKTAFFDPERMAKRSLDDSGGLVSDTLARIYINQGNLDKALEAYEQLILKYPEKSGYFAARIQKVEELKRKKHSSK
jgi:tetratricopeptide (TPR) repeat protein